MENEQQNVGAVRKVGDFLGISKFGRGLATAGRVITGETGRDIQRQEELTARSNKIFYAYKQETDPDKKARLLVLARDLSKTAAETSAFDIDPGLALSNKEILGSAANIGLNILTPGAFTGGKAAMLAKNVALGGGFGAASGLEKGRPAGGIVGSAVGGAIIGGAVGGVGLMARALKEFTSQAVPKWLMDRAIRPTLDEARKTVKYGQKTLGEELLKEGVKGGPRKLLEIAESKSTSLEDELQTVLNSPTLAEARITKDKIAPYLKDLIEAKTGVPGLGGDIQRIQNLFNDLPKEMTLQEANQLKRKIYTELRDVSYKLDAKLGTKAKSLKLIASGLKQEIEKEVGGNIVRDINQKLSIYGRLENRIVDQMARSMKNNQLGLTDAILVSGGAASMNPLVFLGSLVSMGVRKAVGSTAVSTGVAQGLRKLEAVGTGKTAQTIGGGLKRTVLNIP